MTMYIATRLHQLLEMAGHEMLLNEMADLPHYVIDRQLIDMFIREDLAISVKAVIEAGIAQLPFPQMLVEYDMAQGGRPFRILVRLSVTPAGFAADVVVNHGTMLRLTRRAIDMTLDPVKGGVDVGKADDEVDQISAVFALMLALLMLNVRGIDKTVIDPVRLNKARTVGSAGKPRVPTHTLLHIGTVTRRDGSQVSFGGHRQMPVHLRAGHVRNQAHGLGRLEHKLIYIPPVLVNYVEGDEVRVPKRVVAR